MPDELEERLQRTLGELEPGADVTERARAAALGSLPPPRARSRKPLVLVAAACAVAFVFGGVTLAATGGGLPLVGGESHHHPQPPPAPAHRPGIQLPRGAIAFSATGGARAWLATSSGARLRGKRLSALAVSPGAVNLFEGSGSALVAVSVADGHVAFTRHVPGEPIAAAWAPAGIRVAYVVRTGDGNRLYDMYGNGRHAFLVARRTDGGTPTWRWDSLAFAYVRADGTVMVHSVIDGASSALPRRCGLGRPADIAFAPFGGLLAIADRAGHVQVSDTLHHGRTACFQTGGGGMPKVAWLEPRQLVVGAGRSIARLVAEPGLTGAADVTRTPGQVAGLVAAPGGHRIAVAIRDAGGRVRVVEARTPRFSEASFPLRIYRVLADLGETAGPIQLTWQ
jgi:hypothetical protein